jgi:site-specific recombinase XerD
MKKEDKYIVVEQITQLVNEYEHFYVTDIAALNSDTFQLEHPSDIDADIIRAWMLALMEKGDTARSVNRKLSSLRSYWRYLLRQGLVTSNPTQKVLTPKIKKALPSFLKEEELNDLLDKAREEGQTDSFTESRDNLILEMFCLTGIRRAELIGLKTGDVDIGGDPFKKLFHRMGFMARVERLELPTLGFGDRCSTN